MSEIETDEYWWVRWGDIVEPAHVVFRGGEPFIAWLTGNEAPVSFPAFDLVMRIPDPSVTPPNKDMTND